MCFSSNSSQSAGTQDAAKEDERTATKCRRRSFTLLSAWPRALLSTAHKPLAGRMRQKKITELQQVQKKNLYPAFSLAPCSSINKSLTLSSRIQQETMKGQKKVQKKKLYPAFSLAPCSSIRRSLSLGSRMLSSQATSFSNSSANFAFSPMVPPLEETRPLHSLPIQLC